MSSTDEPAVLERARAAARRGDLTAIVDLVDWPLTGAPGIAQGTAAVLADGRIPNSEQGIDALEQSVELGADIAEFLELLTIALFGSDAVTPADETVRATVLETLRIVPMPASATPRQHAYFARMREKAAALTDVYVIHHWDGDLPVAVTPDGDRLVLPLALPAWDEPGGQRLYLAAYDAQAVRSLLELNEAMYAWSERWGLARPVRNADVSDEAEADWERIRRQVIGAATERGDFVGSPAEE